MTDVLKGLTRYSVKASGGPPPLTRRQLMEQSPEFIQEHNAKIPWLNWHPSESGEWVKFSDVEKALGGWVSVEGVIDGGDIDACQVFVGVGDYFKTRTVRTGDKVWLVSEPEVGLIAREPSPPKETT